MRRFIKFVKYTLYNLTFLCFHLIYNRLTYIAVAGLTFVTKTVPKRYGPAK